MQRKNYILNDITVERLEKLKKKLGLGYSDIIRRAVELFWEKEGK